MISYKSAKNLVSYFTTIEDVMALVRVEYESNLKIGKDEMPKMQRVCLIEINYYPKDIGEKPIVTLEIDTLFGDKEEGGKRVEFDLSTCADGNNDLKIEQQRANLVKEIAERIVAAMDWEWLEEER